MKNPFQPGDKKLYHVKVTRDMLAQFESGIVHEVYGTFALGRDAEWACRLFVLEMLEPGEEGIGAHLSVDHLYPAPVGSSVVFEATLEKVEANEVICRYEAHANGRMIARGTQIQKIIDKGRFDKLLQSIDIK
jgi:predicted thioesterase